MASKSSPQRSAQRDRTPAPRWRDIVLPVLYPPAPSPASWRRWAWRMAFWLLLASVFAAGVVLPLAQPELLASFYAAVLPAPQPAASTPAAPSTYPAGTRLRDCADDRLCPWLRVLPPGRFVMGSPTAEQGRSPDEGPQHQVNITQSLAVMETEVTRGQFAAFVNDSPKYEIKLGCYSWNGKEWAIDASRNWRSPGFEQTDDHPVVCVSWDDATAFAQWLSRRTGQQYRLLSEAEWEYAARAGAGTRFSFGDQDQYICAHANVADRSAKAQFKAFKVADCDDGHVFTAPARSFKANGFGLFDMHGNAWEWASDCWHEDYKGALEDGTSWQAGCNEDRRVLRGGGWGNYPDNARSASRGRFAPDNRNYITGFRLARTLNSSILRSLPPTQQSAK